MLYLNILSSHTYLGCLIWLLKTLRIRLLQCIFLIPSPISALLVGPRQHNMSQGVWYGLARLSRISLVVISHDFSKTPAVPVNLHVRWMLGAYLGRSVVTVSDVPSNVPCRFPYTTRGAPALREFWWVCPSGLLVTLLPLHLPSISLLHSSFPLTPYQHQYSSSPTSFSTFSILGASILFRPTFDHALRHNERPASYHGSPAPNNG